MQKAFRGVANEKRTLSDGAEAPLPANWRLGRQMAKKDPRPLQASPPILRELHSFPSLQHRDQPLSRHIRARLRPYARRLQLVLEATETITLWTKMKTKGVEQRDRHHDHHRERRMYL